MPVQSPVEVKVWVCAGCGKVAEKPAPPRMPRGWKRRAEEVFCQNCWCERYMLRAVAIPIASPLGETTWKDFDADLHRMWAATTNCSNWMLTELYAHDVRRDGSSPSKMPRMEHTYLYPGARARFPELPSQSVASLEQAITQKYRATRYDVVWRSSAVLPTYRYPAPFPIHNQSWHIRFDDDNRIALSVRIADHRIELRLKGGPQFHRQRRAVEQMVRGEAIRGECAIYKRGTATMAKMVAWLPRPEGSAPKSGSLIVRTGNDSLLIAVNAKDERVWVWNADQVRRWHAEHRRQLERWSDDQKAENRPVPDFAARRQAAAQKYNHRMDAACHQGSAYVAGYAARRRFAAVSYDDRETSFCPDFPWARLRTLLAQKLDAHRIEFIPVASGEVKGELPPPLAEGEDHAG